MRYSILILILTIFGSFVFPLFPRDFITWNIDYLHMGPGGDTSWGRMVHKPYRIPAANYCFDFTIEILNGNFE